MVAAASATAIASDKPTNQRSAGTPSSRITTAPAAKIKPPRFPPTRIADMLISGSRPLIRHLLDGAYCTRTIIQVKRPYSLAPFEPIEPVYPRTFPTRELDRV